MWSFADAWALTIGGRLEQWRAYGGLLANASSSLRYSDRQRTDFSPKTSLSWDFSDDWQLRLAHGKAVRYPTVAELFQGTISANAIVNNNPALKPERDESTDLTLNRQLANGHWRVSLFQDRIANALYSQTDITVTPTVTSVQNIGKMRSRGVEGELGLTDGGPTDSTCRPALPTTMPRRWTIASTRWPTANTSRAFRRSAPARSPTTASRRNGTPRSASATPVVNTAHWTIATM